MAQKIVSITVILAIIACPMWCADGSGACCADRIHSHAADVCTPQESSCDCCENSHRRQQPPADFPDQQDNLCQGICGGGVMLEPHKILSGNQDSFLGIPVRDISVDVLLTVRETETSSNDRHRHDSGGRSLRTLLSSYLC